MDGAPFGKSAHGPRNARRCFSQARQDRAERSGLTFGIVTTGEPIRLLQSISEDEELEIEMNQDLPTTTKVARGVRPHSVAGSLWWLLPPAAALFYPVAVKVRLILN
jgi:hypothetical protein